MSDAPPPQRPVPPGYGPPAAVAPQPLYRVTEPAEVAPTVTYILLALTGLVFLAQLISAQNMGVSLGDDWPAIKGAKDNGLIAIGQVWRLITPMFLHGSLPHFLFNMYALYALGRGLERYYGHARFLALYFVGGFAGNVFSMIFTALPSLGASTAIFGLLGAEGVFLYQNRKLLGARGRNALTQVITIAILNMLIGLSVPRIDIWGHVGGLIGGVLYAWFAGPLMEVVGVPPDTSIVDRRGKRGMVSTAIWVAALFALLAFVTIAFRAGFS